MVAEILNKASRLVKRIKVVLKVALAVMSGRNKTTYEDADESADSMTLAASFGRFVFFHLRVLVHFVLLVHLVHHHHHHHYHHHHHHHHHHHLLFLLLLLLLSPFPHPFLPIRFFDSFFRKGTVVLVVLG
jgi:hypothetical protein